MPDDLSDPIIRNLVISLPALSPKPGAVHPDGKDCNCEKPNASFNFTEAELVNNPGVYNEDPGSFCKPFSNPERVVSEKAFSVISRVQQPDISPLPSARLKSQQLLDLDPEPDATPDPRPAGAVPRPERPDGLMVSAAAAPGGIRVVNYDRDVLLKSLGRASKPTVHTEPPAVMKQAQAMPSGRTTMDAEHPAQWEDNIAQYQACSVALGHILEFRVRTRSNGYSLGTVASTLTLAPRQTKRIQKVEFERVERARREERQQQADSVSDTVTRERDYNDTVAAYLSEWAAGSSESGTAAAAGGFGFAIPPFVGGVGGGTSSAWSNSEQEGVRNVQASEQQRLRDAIRRHGDSLRRYQSTVVSEVTQQETVTGTTEVLRNPNYGHSLTVIYYQILRHLAVATEFAGVRECLYVPFAIKPFTLQRAYRWREALGRYLRTPRLARNMKYLRDVITNFATSSVKPGTRASQPLTYVRGSVYINLAIERPVDAEEGTFDAAQWRPYSSYFGVPAYGIWAKLAAQAVAGRDALFQREHAPTIASKWLNKLQVRVGRSLVKADFTMATRYTFNQPVRVDFTIPASDVSALTRNSLITITINTDEPLPPGSVANVTRMQIRYGTADFERTINSEAGMDDLVEPETGATSTESANLQFPTDSWDAVDERELMRHGVAELIEHFNEHVEFYHKAVWWSMDRDRLMMMLDGFYVPDTNTGIDRKISIASVVDREPIAIIGNALVYRVGAGAFLGIDNITEPKELYARYAGREPAQDPLYISLPTDGLYAQTIMDECLALEEHQGSVDWVLNDPDPELGTIDPSLMMSRRADVSSTLTPTQMPSTIINLQNAPEAPAPTGLGGVLGAVGNANSFRDMAGLAGTQANAAAALQTAANLATNFGNQAAALKMAEMAKNKQATEDADKRMASVRRAKELGLISDEDASDHTNRILADTHSVEVDSEAPHSSAAINSAIEAAKDAPGSTIEATTVEGTARVTIGQPVPLGPKKKASILVIYDRTLDKDHLNALVDSSYKNAETQSISDFRSLQKVLSKYSEVETLVIFTHSIPGSLLLGGAAPTTGSQHKYFADSGVLVTKAIRFEGCSIMKDPMATSRLVSGVSAKNVIVTGYTMFSVFQSDKIRVPKKTRGETAEEYETNLGRVRADIKKLISGGRQDYLMPGTPSPDDMVRTPGEKTLTFRWFREDLDEERLPESSSDRRRIFSLNSLTFRTIATAADAQKARDDFGQPVHMPELVTVTDITAVGAAPQD